VKDFTAADLNRAQVMPSAQEVGRMEIAIAWPARYLRRRPIVMRVVQRVAVLRAREIETEMIARRLRQSPVRMRRINRLGLDVIALGLRCDGVAVF
jgi:hypothetical protein